MSTKIDKPKPEVGMAVVWADPKTLNSEDAYYLQSIIKRYGDGPFRVDRVDALMPVEDNSVAKAEWSARLTKDGEFLMQEPEEAEDPGPQFFHWIWLQPIPQDDSKLQIGSLVTWKDPNLVHKPKKSWDAGDIISRFVEDYGTGPFIVAIQEGVIVKLIDNKGQALSYKTSPRCRDIHRCFLQEL
jgi:hypothetical protein